MQATVQAMGQVGQHLGNSKKQKKRDRSLLRQTSFFKGGKGHRARLSTKQKSELERGVYFAGHLYKRSSSGSWKKKWCVLKGAVLSYSKLVNSISVYCVFATALCSPRPTQSHSALLVLINFVLHLT